MAVRDSQGGDGGTATLPDAVPLSLAHLTRLSWELGSHTIEDEDATAVSCWARRDDRWRLALFAVTNETAVVRVRTPVGRERYYGAIRSELDAAIRQLDGAASWHRVD
ncbi:hypothetical protein MBEHAL_0721 [Halarchaeum acidiphilum MH1-52-1]|uniref:Uncharacterized protein n=1 Tax=Halarchaeum acidiphilum MH1-52-1 TaxID=1261545 RepID=U2YE14_9EURY|nr:hypothetical protein [Halarchaeum acidiphilum]GAD51961.1 hypothetical protein MBEHAL_0721 [Halarchaeum acidiphilum MH1-52-1]